MDEQLRILKMVEEGTITAEQGANLMAAMHIDQPPAAPAASSYDKKMFRVIVDSETGDKVKVQFPVGAIKKILKAPGKGSAGRGSLEHDGRHIRMPGRRNRRGLCQRGGGGRHHCPGIRG